MTLSSAAFRGDVDREVDANLRRLASSVIDFSNFVSGDVLSAIAPGANVTALKRLSDGSLIPGEAMIFDSSNPTGGDYDLASPNAAFGGPGVGSAGTADSIFPNDSPQGMILMISADENSGNPNDNGFGGILTFTFDPPLNISTIGLLDNEGKRLSTLSYHLELTDL